MLFDTVTFCPSYCPQGPHRDSLSSVDYSNPFPAIICTDDMSVASQLLEHLVPMSCSTPAVIVITSSLYKIDNVHILLRFSGCSSCFPMAYFPHGCQRFFWDLSRSCSKYFHSFLAHQWVLSRGHAPHTVWYPVIPSGPQPHTPQMPWRPCCPVSLSTPVSRPEH